MSGLTGELLMFLAIALIIGAICIPGIFRKKSNNQTNDSRQKTDASNITPVIQGILKVVKKRNERGNE
jgi:multidrug resistance efflux pump